MRAPRPLWRRTPLRDGYDFAGSITLDGKEYRCLYRPMLAHDIRSTVKEARWLSEETGREVIRSAALGQLLACDSDLEVAIHEGHPQVIPELWRRVTGISTHPQLPSPQWERESADNLYAGVSLRILHPEVANRKCSDCRIWWYDTTTGRICRRNGEPQRRPEDQLLPCQIPEMGCPKGTPEKDRSLTEYNRLAAETFVRWDATGTFPDDPIVRRNAAIIQKAIRDSLRKLKRGLRSGVTVG